MNDIRNNRSISVYNHNCFHVSIVTNVKTHSLEPCRDNNPTMDYLTFEEIEYVNAQSNAIKTGLLRFAKEQEKEIYDALNIENYENILTNENIKEFLLNPSKEGLQAILDIRDEMTFERVRGIMTNLINSGEYDISNRVINIIQLRYSEFRKGIAKTNIVLREKDGIQEKNSSAEVDALKEQNKTLQEQMNQMQKMMEQMMAMQQVNASKHSDEKVDENVINAEPKKPGRPSTKK